MATLKLCSIPDCNKPVHCRDMCTKHYRRFMAHGDPLKEPRHVEARQFLEDTVYNYRGDDCLIWPFTRVQFGYGRIHIDGVTHRVHRLACEKMHGTPPPNQAHVAHTCGNGHLGCVNPMHLRWATIAENNHDKIAHGRSSRGKRNPTAVLDENKVREIRKLRGVMTQRAIADRYGVSNQTVSLILKGGVWGWVT